MINQDNFKQFAKNASDLFVLVGNVIDRVNAAESDIATTVNNFNYGWTVEKADAASVKYRGKALELLYKSLQYLRSPTADKKTFERDFINEYDVLEDEFSSEIDDVVEAEKKLDALYKEYTETVKTHARSESEKDEWLEKASPAYDVTPAGLRKLIVEFTDRFIDYPQSEISHEELKELVKDTCNSTRISRKYTDDVNALLREYSFGDNPKKVRREADALLLRVLRDVNTHYNYDGVVNTIECVIKRADHWLAGVPENSFYRKLFTDLHQKCIRDVKLLTPQETDGDPDYYASLYDQIGHIEEYYKDTVEAIKDCIL